MHQDDLSDRLNSFSISSNEEKLTQALYRTHIGSSSSSSSTPFNLSAPQPQPQPQSQPQPQPQPHQQQPQQQPIYYSGDVKNKTNYVDSNNRTSDWDPAATSNWKSESTTSQEDDGWGEAPSYTAISQGTYFGFNSIMKTQDTLAPRSPQLNTNTQAAFGRYRNAPVSFVSAVAEAANNSNHHHHHHQ